MPPDAPPPTNVIHRFGLFIEGLKRAMAEGIGRRHDTLGPLAVLLWHYLGRTLRRLAALHAGFADGTLAAAPRRSAAPRRPSDRPTTMRRPPRIPRGPVLLQYYLIHFVPQLRALVEEPEMRALLEASPQAGRLLRPLWRKLTTDPLPEPLRLPGKPPRSAAEPEEASAAPATLPERHPDAPPWRRLAAPAEPPPRLDPWPPPLLPA